MKLNCILKLSYWPFERLLKFVFAGMPHLKLGFHVENKKPFREKP